MPELPEVETVMRGLDPVWTGQRVTRDGKLLPVAEASRRLRYPKPRGVVPSTRDPDGRTTPLDAHIRLARPRTADTEHQRLLRRGFSYSRGHDASGLLDQGLAFVSYSRTLGQFLAVNDRLRGEPLEEYVQPEGGGFFFVLPGVDDGGWLGQQLLA